MGFIEMMFILRTVTLLPQSTALHFRVECRVGHLACQSGHFRFLYYTLPLLFLSNKNPILLIVEFSPSVRQSHSFPILLYGEEGGRCSDKLGLNVPWNNWEDTFFSQPMWNHWLLSLSLKYQCFILFICWQGSKGACQQQKKIENISDRNG